MNETATAASDRMLLVAGVILVILVIAPFLLRWATKRLGRRIKRLLIFCSGAKPHLLEQVPTEEPNYVGLGSAVLITSCVATFSMLVAVSLAFGRPWPTLLPFAIVYGFIIFALDRFLVSGQLNPHQFSSSLVLGDGDARPAAIRTVLRTLLGALPRLVFAVVIGFLIAEPMLLVLFRPEIETRMEAMQKQLAQDAETRVDNAYEDRIKALETPRKGAAAITTNEKDIAKVNKEIEDATFRRDQFGSQAAAECDGATGKVGDSTISGQRGCGPLAANHARNRRIQNDRINVLEKRKAEHLRKKDELAAGIGKEETQRRADLKKMEEQRTKEREGKVAKAQETSGLLIRVHALEQLASVQDPYPVAPTGDEVANGSSEPETHAAGLFGLTVLGKTIWTVRLWLVLLDALPVCFKVMLSLRRRRPYDVLVAETEESAIDEAVLRVAQRREDRDAKLEKLVASRAHRRDRIRQTVDGIPQPRAPRPDLRVTTARGRTTLRRPGTATIGGGNADVQVGGISQDERVRVVWDEGRATYVLEALPDVATAQDEVPVPDQREAPRKVDVRTDDEIAADDDATRRNPVDGTTTGESEAE